MTLHITFIDGSNPYVFYGNAKDIKKKWLEFENVSTARPLFMCGELKCMRICGGGWAVGRYFDGAHKTISYERLGNALNYMEKKEKEINHV